MNKYLDTRPKRILALCGLVFTALAVALAVPGLFPLLFVGCPWILGVVVAVAFAYDWILQGGEDLDEAREEQDASKARWTPGGDTH